ncbi:MAG: hypothetical protein JRG76_03240 [Deltaproteobacteria bacterium]|nr:hypothetical protein [Deltaproteobacteria bacterium]MBW2413505.1 hypothetical protein [Deltaproteobacteria bacterium]
MKALPALASVVLLVFAAACEGEAPVEERRPQYRNSAAEYLLAEQAKKAQRRRDLADQATAERAAHRDQLLKAIPADFPRAFVDFPGASLTSGFEQGGVVIITQQVGQSPEDAWARATDQAAQSGWQLEIETTIGENYEGSFLKGTKRVQLSVLDRKRIGTHVVATLMELDPGAPAPPPE